MWLSLRRKYAEYITSGSQLILAYFSIKSESRAVSVALIGLMAVISLFVWQSTMRRMRTIRDMPTSKVASAAQGYIELQGVGVQFSELPVYSKRRLPCLWYRYEVTDNGKSDIVDSGESSASFVLRDASGDCVIDVENAEIISSHVSKWREGDQRITEWRLMPNDPIYVLGQFRTIGGGTTAFDTNAEVRDLLAEWKRDTPALNKRFDLNKDGKLDMDEWMLARQAALREVNNVQNEVQAVPDTHIMSQPRDGKPFLVSNLSIEKLSSRYMWWTWANLAIFVAALVWLAWLITHPR